MFNAFFILFILVGLGLVLFALYGAYTLLQIVLKRAQNTAEQELDIDEQVFERAEQECTHKSLACDPCVPQILTSESFNPTTDMKQETPQSPKTPKDLMRAYGDTLWLRAIIVLFIVVGLSIPLSMVDDIVYERKHLQSEALEKMLLGWGDVQHIIGPAVIVPYDLWQEETVTEKDAKGEVRQIKQRYKSAIHHKVILPRLVDFQAIITPVERYYGIYAATVYESTVDIAGEFVMPKPADFGKDIATIYWEEAIFSLGLSGLKSLASSVPLVWNGEQMSSFEPSTKAGNLLGAGFHTPITAGLEAGQTGTFKTSLNMRGAKNLRFAPVGETSTITISGDWKDPSFSGEILPTSRTITEHDFTAFWSIPHLSRGYPQVGTLDSNYTEGEEIRSFTVGVDLYEPVTLYRKVDRSLKYGILFIGLTYAALFSLEIIRREKLHYLQYALVGLAMTVFYLSLLSLAEHVAFLTAFGIASAICIAMNSIYVAAATKSKKQGGIIGATLTILYLCLYILLGLEKYALLVGTSLVLTLVIVLMVITRNLNNRKLSD